MFVRFPNEIEKLYKQDLSLYYSILALSHEADETQDSSMYYYQFAKKETDRSGNIYIKSHFYKRFGEYFLRLGKMKEAEFEFVKSLNFAQKVNLPWKK